jgi:AhpD family alkylhydroperoxidase
VTAGELVPRVTPGTLRDLGLVNWTLCRVIARAAGVREAHLFRTLGRQRRLFRAWLFFASRLMPGGTLSRAESELAILRVAHVRGCRYEADHHARLARRAGLTDADVERVSAGPAARGWSERQGALLRAADVLLETRSLDDATWRALKPHFDDAQLVEICILVGHYDMLATTVAALRIERDVATSPS